MGAVGAVATGHRAAVGGARAAAAEAAAERGAAPVLTPRDAASAAHAAPVWSDGYRRVVRCELWRAAGFAQALWSGGCEGRSVDACSGPRIGKDKAPLPWGKSERDAGASVAAYHCASGLLDQREATLEEAVQAQPSDARTVDAAQAFVDRVSTTKAWIACAGCGAMTPPGDVAEASAWWRCCQRVCDCQGA
eukprot:g1745.t1